MYYNAKKGLTQVSKYSLRQALPSGFVESFSSLQYCRAVVLNLNNATMRNMEELRNPALRKRPTEEHTNEILELVRKRAEEDLKNSNVHFDETLLRRASVTRPNEPLPAIRVDNDQTSCLKSRSCPSGMDNDEAEMSARYRWRSLSDAPLLELRSHTPRERTATSPVSDTPVKSRHRKARRVSHNLPPLVLAKEHFERPNCIPSFRRNGVQVLPKEDINMNLTCENDENFQNNCFHYYEDRT